MSNISNFSGVNLQDDVLDPRTARTILSMIEGLRSQIISLNIDGLFQQFSQHAQNTNNPHELSFDDYPSQFIESLFPLYQQLPNSTLTHDQFIDFLQQNPVVLFELVRRLVLNRYSYIDGIGSSSLPAYDASDLVSEDLPGYPSYCSTDVIPDHFFSSGTALGQSGMLTRPIKPIGGNVSLICKAKNTTYNNQIILSSSQTGNTLQIQIQGTNITTQLFTAGNPGGIVALSGNSTIPFALVLGYDPVQLVGNDSIVGIVMSSNTLTVFIKTDVTTVGSISFTISNTFTTIAFDTLTISGAGFHQRKNVDTGDGLTHLSIYPEALTPEMINSLLQA